MRINISRVSMNEKTCPYQGAVWNQKAYEWQTDIESLDALMSEVGTIIVSKAAEKDVEYDVVIYDARIS